MIIGSARRETIKEIDYTKSIRYTLQEEKEKMIKEAETEGI